MKPKLMTSHVNLDHPHCDSTTWICLHGYVKVSSKSIQGLWSHIWLKFGHSYYFGYWLLQYLILLCGTSLLNKNWK